MIDSLKLEPRRTQRGCGIYEVQSDSYTKLFVTDAGRAIPVNRAISEDDLLQAYEWGRLEAEETQQNKTDLLSKELEKQDRMFEQQANDAFNGALLEREAIEKELEGKVDIVVIEEAFHPDGLPF